MDKLTPNENKIIAALKAINIEVCSKDLAKLADINEKSIGRYIKKLTAKGYVEQYIKQIHNKRFRMIKISTSGKNIEISETPVKKESKPKAKKDSKTDTIDLETIEKIALKTEIKSQLRIMILNLVVRKTDFKPMNFKSAAEYRNEMMELIELL